jgi:hypothetical protein
LWNGQDSPWRRSGGYSGLWQWCDRENVRHQRILKWLGRHLAFNALVWPRCAINAAQKSCNAPAARKLCRVEDEASMPLPAGPMREACGRPRYPRGRKHAAYLGRVCVSTNRSVTMRRAAGLVYRRIFGQRDHSLRRASLECPQDMDHVHTNHRPGPRMRR